MYITPSNPPPKPVNFKISVLNQTLLLLVSIINYYITFRILHSFSFTIAQQRTSTQNIPWLRMLLSVFESNLNDIAYCLCNFHIRAVILLWPKSHLEVKFHMSSHMDVGLHVRSPLQIITFNGFNPQNFFLK
jgi:hypothetical protein